MCARRQAVRGGEMDRGLDQGVGGEIKRLRGERDWSMARLAVEADMSVSGVSMIENGKRNLTTTTLGKLARAFGVEVADLFPKAETPLWSDEPPERRDSGFSFREVSESLERYCERWENQLAEGSVDNRALDEFLATAEGWLPALDVALRAERDAKGLGTRGTEIGQANRRYLEVFSQVVKILKSRLVESPAEGPEANSNVVYLRD